MIHLIENVDYLIGLFLLLYYYIKYHSAKTIGLSKAHQVLSAQGTVKIDQVNLPSV